MFVRSLQLAPITLLLGACAGTAVLDDSGTAVADPTASTTTSTDTSTSTPTTQTTPPFDYCVESGDAISCDHHIAPIDPGGPFDEVRDVHWRLPEGVAPANGWPVAIGFQGSLISAERNWIAQRDEAFGIWWQVQATEQLLQAGYAVITPEAKVNGATFWDTNIPPWSLAWETSEDHRLMLALFTALQDGTFGDVDANTQFAYGISSGGYMSSRMTIAYPGRFQALAIQSASYAWCSGAYCVVPNLPADHAPTLLLHGDQDTIVPIETAESYRVQLVDAGIEHRTLIDANAGHAWFEGGPEAVVDWFNTHRPADI